VAWHGLDLGRVYERLLAHHGRQDWWPAETAFEVMIGAVLTQNTAWANVERALRGLRRELPLTPEALTEVSAQRLAELIRPAGYFNVKARRLQAFCAELIAAGGEDALSRLETGALRRWLLAIHGVGPETADDILLYAFGRPVFVVDAYTRRLFQRLGMIDGDEPYERIRARFEQALRADAALYNEYHALIVQHGKHPCRARAPRCAECALSALCPRLGLPKG
jgi:endonuclease-3 related protein